MDVAEWLRDPGLEQYMPAFRDNHIDGKVLRRLPAEDLRELGVASIGHRRRLLDAIGALGDDKPAAEASPAPTPAPSRRSSGSKRADSAVEPIRPALAELSEQRLQEALRRLSDAGLVFQRGAPPAAEYLFKHALVQEAGIDPVWWTP